MLVTGVIAAGGTGKRLGEKIPKQFLDLEGKPVIAWSLEAFSFASEIGEVILVSPVDHVEQAREYAEKYCIGKPVKVVEGGKTRQESVRNGLDASSKDLNWIAVHDAARPFITPQEIDSICLMARDVGAAIAGARIVDTIKEVHNQIITRTLDRSILVSALTPQVCRKDDLLSAYETASQTGFAGTDEASLLENAGMIVAVYFGSSLNFKITTPDDLEIARAVAAHLQRHSADES
ncbi:MAG: 2-C-methyl-D-erythritol 4-phosphate cytidylyltransferase [Thermodesulfatator sp.]|nr:MAG: 2-C-methyl-D-erythritol 4-phosphate cytidylyltransferase [Thermodesulfatator sp.]